MLKAMIWSYMVAKICEGYILYYENIKISILSTFMDATTSCEYSLNFLEKKIFIYSQDPLTQNSLTRKAPVLYFLYRPPRKPLYFLVVNSLPNSKFALSNLFFIAMEGKTP